MPQALHRTITRFVSAVWRFSQPCARARGRNRGGHPEPAIPTMSLNFCVSDGRHIVCTRYRNHPRQDPPSLFCLTGAGFACDEEKSCFRVTASGEYHRASFVAEAFLARAPACSALSHRGSIGVAPPPRPPPFSIFYFLFGNF